MTLNERLLAGNKSRRETTRWHKLRLIYCEGLCGILSIFSSMRYCLGDPDTYDNIWLALGLIPLGLFFDFMDGKVARWRKKASLMGQELDSLADLVWLPSFPLQFMPIRQHFAYKSLHYHSPDLFRCCPRLRGSSSRTADCGRPLPSRLLRPLRFISLSPLQCYCRNSPQRCHRQSEIL